MTVKKVNKGGRPRKYNDVDKMQQKIDEYFDIGIDYVTITAFDKQTGEFVEYKKTTPTITGLALYLGFVSRQSMFDYEAKPEFSDIIKKARTRIELEYEKMLHLDKCTGAIFALKNFGWKDKQETEIAVGENTQETFLQHLKDLGKNAD